MRGPAAPAALLLLLALPLKSQESGKAYELDLPWRPVPGHRCEVTLELSQKTRFSVRAGAKTLREEESAEALAFTAVEEILEANGREWTEARYTFTRATRRTPDKFVSLGFEGGTVLVTRTLGGGSFRTEEGEPLKIDDLAAIRRLLPLGRVRRDVMDPSGRELFGPRRPVRVGDRWTPDIGSIAQQILPSDPDAIDPVLSTGTVSLRGVHPRGGSEFGAIDGRMDLRLRRMGSLRLDHPLSIRLTADLEAPVDGEAPDGSFRMRVELKGRSGVTSPDGRQSHVVEVEIDQSRLFTRKTLQETLPRK